MLVLVISTLDYCSALCIGLLLQSVQKLQLEQNAVARILIAVAWRNCIIPAFCSIYTEVQFASRPNSSCIQLEARILKGQPVPI